MPNPNGLCEDFEDSPSVEERYNEEQRDFEQSHQEYLQDVTDQIELEDEQEQQFDQMMNDSDGEEPPWFASHI